MLNLAWLVKRVQCGMLTCWAGVAFKHHTYGLCGIDTLQQNAAGDVVTATPHLYCSCTALLAWRGTYVACCI